MVGPPAAGTVVVLFGPDPDPGTEVVPFLVDPDAVGADAAEPDVTVPLILKTVGT